MQNAISLNFVTGGGGTLYRGVSAVGTYGGAGYGGSIGGAVPLVGTNAGGAIYQGATGGVLAPAGAVIAPSGAVGAPAGAVVAPAVATGPTSVQVPPTNVGEPPLPPPAPVLTGYNENPVETVQTLPASPGPAQVSGGGKNVISFAKIKINFIMLIIFYN